MKSIIVIVLLFLISQSPVYAVQEINSEPVDEKAFFSKEDTFINNQALITDKVTQSIDEESYAFSGFLNSRTSYDLSREWLKDESDGFDKNTFSSYFQSNYSLDIRKRKNIKGFVNASLNYYPSGIEETEKVTHNISGTTISYESYETRTKYAVFQIEEIFADINFNKMVYFRFGKQNLKWGTGIIWQPSDLINIDKKNVLDPSQVREGTYGAKISVPFGTVATFYTFVGMNYANNVDMLSCASKLEILIRETEISVSVLARKGSVPVYGFDFTTSLLTLDVYGEASASYGDPEYRLDYGKPDAPGMYKRDSKWITSAVIGFGRGFEFLDIADRIRINAEFFYNGRGYRDNIFGMQDSVLSYFGMNNLYTPGYYGLYYGAVFLTYGQLFIQDLDFTIFYSRNISDESSLASGLLSYNLEYNVRLELLINGYFGKANRENTFAINTSTYERQTKALFAEFCVKLGF